MKRTLANLDYPALVADVHTFGGFTVALDGSRPSDGYAVSLSGHERRTGKAGNGADDIYRYVIAHGSALRDTGAYLGAYLDTDSETVYLDVSHVFLDRQNAETLAVLEGQRAIFDLLTGETIPVPATLERHAR